MQPELILMANYANVYLYTLKQLTVTVTASTVFFMSDHGKAGKDIVLLMGVTQRRGLGYDLRYEI